MRMISVHVLQQSTITAIEAAKRWLFVRMATIASVSRCLTKLSKHVPELLHSGDRRRIYRISIGLMSAMTVEHAPSREAT